MTGQRAAGATGGVTVHRAGWVLPMDGPPFADGEVAVRDGLIVAVGRGLDGDVRLDHEGVLLPGLVNAHAHLFFGPSFADLATGEFSFDEWIVRLLPRRRAMAPEEWVAEARASAAELLRTGTTAVADVVSETATLEVLDESGLAGTGYVEVAGADATRWAQLREGFVADLDRYQGAGVSPHTLYTLGTDVVRELIALARSRGRRLHPHLAETADEAEFVMSGTGRFAELNRRFALEMELLEAGSGRSPAAHLAELGGLGSDVHVAHGVHLDAADRALLREHDTAVALCARSNAILRAGEAPVAAFRAERSPVAVGTDSLASSPDLDLLAEVRSLRALAVRQGSPEPGLDEWLVTAATRGGARALGLEGTIGVLAPGARADLAVVQGEPGDDPYATVVSGRAVATYLRGEKVQW